MEQTELKQKLGAILLSKFKGRGYIDVRLPKGIYDAIISAMEDALSLNRSVPTKVTDEEIK